MKRDSKQQRRILVVDDNPDIIDLLRSVLELEDFAIDCARDGVAALNQARSLLPDLIVLDLVLPELDGFSVCESLRRDRTTAHIPIILLTGLSSELNRFAGLDCGASDYISKPFNPAKLVSRVKALLGGKAGKTIRAKRSSVNPTGSSGPN